MQKDVNNGYIWNDYLCKKTRITYMHFCYTKVPPITTRFYTAHDNNYTDSTKSSTLHYTMLYV